ncbi:MAG TPA: MaoC/PaaZ C-terminal domain-containing protein [Ferrovibrio sp.]|jgi:acyl dehydratase|uniref:MaoC/PaaZ C-terminal domain-containing protein n=1 Tax=Ferrovibrio sp. TaxID=1917215 RepID=UPI002B4B5C0C|nr:MaoC/PaaZ C-terminal domain-containing protein [Ferrovibrio sp.]HLT77839.1 MaoC/PaaZ C-terminal domain-containing protein [Ferrovibrio sp.]
MPIVYDDLMRLDLPEREFSYTERDTMLYALSVGMGHDPMDLDELPFVYEKGLKALPSQATVITWDDSWVPRTGINFLMVVHGEQRVTLHRPLPTQGRIRSKVRVKDAFDKGAGKGAILLIENTIRDAESGELLATLLSTTFARGDGGFGGPARSPEDGPPQPHPIPDRAPDVGVTARTQPNQALFYRLCGDRNPLHADPAVAKAAGFPRPILHGLCTYGHAVRAVVKAACNHDPALVRHIEARFTAPVFPGETIHTEIWRDGNTVSFRARLMERDVIALDHGKVELRD